MSGRWPERIWYDQSTWAVVARSALAPAALLYAGASSMRNWLYDAGLLRSIEPELPALGIGNLSVGGTGKTPVAAWATGRLLARGAHPAVVLRGYGDDEPLVHQRLNPRAIVVADANRVRGVARARTQGADCVILDDAFQHRRIRRQQDWLLVAAEQWRSSLRCLPAGPLRESGAAISRAALVVVTRKSSSLNAASEVLARLAEQAPGTPGAIVHLAPDALVNAFDGTTMPLSALGDTHVLAVAAIAGPEAFFAQLRSTGAVVEEASYRDHHAFSDREVHELVRSANRVGMAVCTLKDAVKLAPLWPRNGTGPALWYVSQRAVVERGEAALDASLSTLLAARASIPPTAGPAGPDSPAHGHRSSPADQ